MYASIQSNSINNNLSAIGMFQNVADFTSKFIKANEGSKQKSFLRIWDILFERIENLGFDFRAEVRRTNALTAENIIMTNGASFQWESGWKCLLERVFPTLLVHSLQKYN